MTEARRYTKAKLTITVRPVDASPPVVESSSDEGEVEENSPKGTKILDADGTPIRLTVSDPDLVNIRIVSYKLWSFERYGKSFCESDDHINHSPLCNRVIISSVMIVLHQIHTYFNYTTNEVFFYNGCLMVPENRLTVSYFCHLNDYIFESSFTHYGHQYHYSIFFFLFCRVLEIQYQDIAMN